MTAVWIFFSAQLRLRWRAWLALALLAGVFGGVVLAAAAGARRTSSAYPRLVAWSRPPDLMVFSVQHQSATFATIPLTRVSRLPQVSEAAPVTFFNTASPSDLGVITPEANPIPAAFWHRKLLAGRLPDPRRAGEVDVSFTVAEARHLQPGDTLRVRLLTLRGPLVRAAFRVVGVDAAPGEFPPHTGTGNGVVWATPAFYRQHRDSLDTYSGVAMRLRHGAADAAAVERSVHRLGGGKVAQSYLLATQSANTQHSIRLQAVALWLLAGLLAVIGALVTGQLLARLSFLESGGDTTLRALGMSRAQLLSSGLARAALIGAGAATAAVTIAVAASPVFPVGLGRIAEPDPGLRADYPLLALGWIGVVLVTAGCAAWPAWQAARRASAADDALRTPGAERRNVLIRAAAGIRSVPGAMGVRLALQRGAGRTALPVRSTVAGAVVGVAALTAALVFSASLSHLLTTPRLYGVTWNAYISSLSSGTGVAGAVPAVSRDTRVAAWSAGYSGAPLQIRGVQVGAMAMGPGHGGRVQPVLIQGRLPSRTGEMALGRQTESAIGATAGDTVNASLAGSRPRPMRIVGTTVFPAFDDTLQLGKGAALTIGGLRQLLPPRLPAPPLDTLLVRYRPGTAAQARTDTLALRLARTGIYAVVPPDTPIDLVNFGRVQGLPLLLGGALGGLALLTISHLLITSVRRRRRDLAVLRALGFTRGQVRRTVAWQACILTSAALVIGIPLGIVGGRLAWRLFAGQLGIPPVLDLPAGLLAAMVPAGLALAVAVATLPGESAARAQPADVLRSE